VISNAERADILVQALYAGLEGNRRAIEQLYADDVHAWTPSLSAKSRDQLMEEFDRRDDAFTDFDLDAVPLDVGGEFACVEWSVSMTHSGPFEVAEGQVVEATGTRVTLHGVSVAEFHGNKICGLRQYWDELALFEQLGLVQPS
jgi:ketosteroid isomerase-like protein